ncbi:putative secreted protein (Por secretion system target) [Dyadobacter jejuensis]|uniref:Putative secreted protein (Por secretion system target) n=1 Tax=Dyadobacter jejuensis TaxID=1082580 RepID=A0A316AJ30_9BACT|nr:alpha-amylase family glycosyl hydrolase [Dyadobacter jejuensis]PWJ56984.1 putative secreted protein (Por secretion system target) [Dyadobacter jejuensis]
MMKNYILVLYLCCLSLWGQAQALQVSPAFPAANGTVTLTFDLNQATDNRKEGLLNKTTGLYIWTWGGSDASNKVSEYGPAGQTSFNQPFDPGKLTHVSGNTWSITLTPTQYLGISPEKKLAWLGVLVKNADGSAQTEDFTIDLFDAAKLQVQFRQPLSDQFFVEANESIPIEVVASQKSKLELSVDGTLIATTLDSTLKTTIPSGSADNQTHTVTIRAQVEGQAASDEFRFTVSPHPPIIALPSGLKRGINYTSESSATLVLYAPNKKFVHLLGPFSDWATQPNYLMNRTPDGDTYWLPLTGLSPGQEYPYQYLVDGSIAIADPYSDKILDRNNDSFIPASHYPNLLAFPDKAKDNIVSVLQTNQPSYDWQTSSFQRPQPADLVVYEVLVRDFTSSRWYQTLTDTLPYLQRLGINAIELMPIMEFAGNDSWGYNPIFPMAPDKAYGTRQELKAFIDQCHKLGIAVLLDMVLNQADYDFPYVKMYWDGNQPSSDSPMFNQQATHPYNVFFDFNHEAPATQQLVRDVTSFWLEQYRFDGYRFDLSKGFTQVNSGNNVSAWGQYDPSRVAIWKGIYDHIRSIDSSAYVILEHFGSDKEEAELTNYGMLVWDNHNGVFRETIKNGKGNFNRLSWKNHDGFTRPAAIGYMESHDEERLVYDATTNGGIGNGYSARTLDNALERLKASAALALLTPGPKMIWQFGELGYDISINENGRTGAKPVKWEYLQQPNRQRVYEVFSELIEMKRSDPAFRSSTFELQADEQTIKKLHIQGQTQEIWVLANLGLQTEDVAIPSGDWYDYFTGRLINISRNTPFKPGQFHILTSIQHPEPTPGLVPWSLELITAVEPAPANTDILLAPNPVLHAAHIQWASDYQGPITLSLCTPSGQTLERLSYNKTVPTFDQFLRLDHLQTGMYLLIIREGENTFTKKWIKQ